MPADYYGPVRLTTTFQGGLRGIAEAEDEDEGTGGALRPGPAGRGLVSSIDQFSGRKSKDLRLKMVTETKALGTKGGHWSEARPAKQQNFACLRTPLHTGARY